mgnify:CR=1 FL=1
MKATITSVTDISLSGEQSVVFDISDNKGTVLTSQSVSGDVDTIQDQIKQMLNDYAAKLKSIKRLKVGDVVNQ